MFGYIFGLGPAEMIALMVLGVILFGRNLPSIGRSIGKSIVEFKSAMNGIETSPDASASPQRPEIAQEPVRPPQRVTSAVPKFDESPNSAPKA